LNHVQELNASNWLVERMPLTSDVPLMNRRDVLAKLAEWGKEYPIFLTLQTRTGALSTALREFGAMCLRAENYDLAVEVLLAAVSMRPDNCWLWHNLSTAYQGASQEDRALQCARRAIDLDGSHAEIWTQFGVLLRDTGQAKQAKVAFELASRASL
jgi:Tfp pilus assembly protein PilF